MDLNQLADAIAARLKQAAPSTGINLRQFSELYMDRYAKVFKRSWKDDEARVRLHIVPTLGDRLVSDLTKLDVLELHTAIGKDTPYAANRVLEQLAKMYRLAQDWGHYPQEAQIPTTGIKAFPEIPRDRFVGISEMERLASSIALVRVSDYRVLFWLYLLTALRRNELLASRWDELDTERWELRIPSRRSKNGKAHYIPMPAEAMAMLSSMPRRGPFIFAGQKPNTHLHKTSVWRCWDKVRTRADLEDVRIHDLRRTAASWIAQSGEPLAVLGKLLNHSSTRTTEIYARFGQDDVKRALQRHAGALSKMIR